MGFPSTLLLSLLLFLLLHSSPSSANEGNLIVTGDVLKTDTQLTTPNAVFVIQNDCNLVLYNKGTGFVSNTSGRGRNCTVTLSQYGQLKIKNGHGKSIWSTPVIGPKGEYAAILQPNGQVGIYGPSLWSTSQFSNFKPKHVDSDEKFKNEPNVPNLLFSSEVLNENSKLVSRDYALEVKEGLKGCRLEFTKANYGTPSPPGVPRFPSLLGKWPPWRDVKTVVLAPSPSPDSAEESHAAQGSQTDPNSKGVSWASPRRRIIGKHCFVRLNFHGQLSLVDDHYRVQWQSNPAHEDGVYVLVVKINGEAVIYGRRIWST